MEEKEITFGKILKVAFAKWKLWVPVAVGVGLVGSLAIVLGYNNLKGKYEAKFSYSSLDLANEKYADGSSFYYRNLVSYDSLSKVKNSNEKYKDIDIDTMLDKGGIGVSKVNDNTTTEKTANNVYTLNVDVRYIKDSKLAKDFIMDITNLPIEKDKDIVTNGSYDSALKLYDAADTFEKQVTYLYSQATSLKLSYKNIVNTQDNKTDNKNTTTTTQTVDVPSSAIEAVSTNVEAIDALVSKDFVNQFNAQINAKGLVKDFEAAEFKNISILKSSYEKEYSLNIQKIEELNKITTPLTVTDEKISELAIRNAELDMYINGATEKIKYYNNPTPEHDKDVADFQATLDYYRVELGKATDSYKGVLKSVYVDGAVVAYDDSQAVKTTGTINTFLAIGLSLVVGVVVGAVVDLIVDRKKLYE